MTNPALPPAFRFKCGTCDEWHYGIPALSASAPDYYYSIPVDEREERCRLNSDVCLVDNEFFFIRANLEIPVEGLDETFSWGVWGSVSKESFADYMQHFEVPDRAMRGPYFAWLSVSIDIYPDTLNLKTMLHPQEPGIRPKIETEPTDHPLAVEQRKGISQERLAEICAHYLH
jgi:hypothetical protein